ncbi:enoyl-CoA hydratase-related protein, partial [Rhodococcus sp. TAF43]
MADEPTGTEPAALYERRGSVAIITLNRPRALNAVNAALSTAVGTLLEQADADDEVRVIVLTGAGRAFCAGADLKALGSGAPLEADGHPEWGFAGYAQHWISKPTIAAVNGFALGGGTELVLASDLSVVDEHAQLGLPEVTRGLFAAAGGVI